MIQQTNDGSLALLPKFQNNEEHLSMIQLPFAGIPIAIIFNLNNNNNITSIQLDTETIQNIFTGIIHYWNDSRIQFHNPTIDLPNENPGLVPDPAWKDQVRGESWYLGDTYHESIGQGDVLTTPLQVNSWTATIANGGKIMQPYLLKEVKDKNGQAVALGKPQVLAENIFDPKFIKVAQDGMRQAVTDGSARALAGLSLAIAGKTGTAQFDARNLSLTHAWFTSYAPANDPQIALTILVESGGEGSTTAVPVAKEVYSWWIANRYNK